MARTTTQRIHVESERYPGLEIDVEGNQATFTYWETCETFMLEDGQARLVASSDVAYVKPELHDHVRELARGWTEAFHHVDALAA